MGIFGPRTPFSGLCKGEGKWGFLDPETLFSRKWGFGPLSGVGGIPSTVTQKALTVSKEKLPSTTVSKKAASLPRGTLSGLFSKCCKGGVWSRGCVAFDGFGGFGGFLPAAMTADFGPRKTGPATRPSKPLTVLTVLAVLVWRHTPPRPHPPFSAS